MDFLRGAALGADGQGKPILAMNSVTKKGESKITPFLKQGKFTTGNQSMFVTLAEGFATIFGKRGCGKHDVM